MPIEGAYIPYPLRLVTRLDRIQITKSGWLHLWDSEHPERRITLKIDPSGDEENQINGFHMERLGKHGEGIVVPISNVGNIITGNSFDATDGLHIDSEGIEP